MLIRTMKMEDIKQVAEIEAQCFSLPWSQKSFEDSIKREDTIFLVCESSTIYDVEHIGRDEITHSPILLSDKKIIGYIGMYISFEEGEITNVAVTPFARQRGIGDALIKAIKKSAKQQNLQQIILEVRVSNKPAINLYEKNGFHFIGIRKNFYEKPTEDAIIMVCDI